MKSQQFIPAVILSTLIIFQGTGTNAQTRLSSFTHFESTIGGINLKTSSLCDIHIGKNRLSAGTQYNIKDNLRNGLSGLQISASREFSFREFSVSAGAFYSWLPFSKLFQETDYGFLSEITFNNLYLSAGGNFKTYSLKNGKIVFDFENGWHVNEAMNILYSVKWVFRPAADEWSFAISLTDYDDFSFSQETNPFIMFSAACRISPSLSLFATTGYKNSGMLNTNVNYFSTFFKTGMTWNLNLTNR